MATWDLLCELGFQKSNILLVDSKGVINKQRENLTEDRRQVIGKAHMAFRPGGLKIHPFSFIFMKTHLEHKFLSGRQNIRPNSYDLMWPFTYMRNGTDVYI
jgi:hypothetical protein